MDHIFEHYNKSGYLHHAYVIEGTHESVVPSLVSAIERNLNMVAKGNPDFMVTRHDSFTITEARALKNVQTRAAWGGERKIYIISALSFPLEAQNALLKTFEEPTEGTHFFIILPRAEILLPTLLSRVLVIGQKILLANDVATSFVEKFLAATLENRFVMIKKLAEKKDRDTVDRELFRQVLDTLEQKLAARTKGRRDGNSARIFREIYRAKSYLATRGASPKMLLEHIAMVV
jgi:DNA polymerase III delta prime subunit